MTDGPRYLVRHPDATGETPYAFWDALLGAWGDRGHATAYTEAERLSGLPVPATAEGYRYGDWVPADGTGPLPAPVAMGASVHPWGWTVRRWGGRRSDRWKTSGLLPEREARQRFAAESEHLRQGGVALFGPDGNRVAIVTAPRLRTRW